MQKQVYEKPELIRYEDLEIITGGVLPPSNT